MWTSTTTTSSFAASASAFAMRSSMIFVILDGFAERAFSGRK